MVLLTSFVRGSSRLCRDRTDDMMLFPLFPRALLKKTLFNYTHINSTFFPLPTSAFFCAKYLFIPFSSHRPGDYLKPGEDEIDGLKRRLDDRLAPPPGSQFDQISHGINNDWEIGDCLAQWWRPNFETFMVS